MSYRDPLLTMGGTETTDEKMECKYYVNELLFYVQNGINSDTKQDIIETCAKFYSEVEIETAKNYLWSKCEQYTSETKTKRKLPNKATKDITDIVELVYSLDWNQCPVRFAAINATKVPSMVCANDNDKNYICKNEYDLSMTKVMKELNDMKQTIETLTKAIDKGRKNDITMRASYNSVVKRTEPRSVTFEQIGAGIAENPDTATHSNSPWNIVARKKKVMVGKNDEDKSLKAATMTYKRELHITRLTLDTTTTSLTTYLNKKGVSVTKCEELKPPIRVTVPITYKSFHVTLTCTNKDKIDKLFDEGEWPQGIAVRRFWIKSNDGQN